MIIVSVKIVVFIGLSITRPFLKDFIRIECLFSNGCHSTAKRIGCFICRFPRKLVIVCQGFISLIVKIKSVKD